MALTSVLLSEETQRRLGKEGLDELAGCMWPVDCQTCGTMLGDDPPALCVDAVAVSATVSLHHEACRTPEWNDSGTMRLAAGDFISFVTRMVLLPVTGRRGEEEWCPRPHVEKILQHLQDHLPAPRRQLLLQDRELRAPRLLTPRPPRTCCC